MRMFSHPLYSARQPFIWLPSGSVKRPVATDVGKFRLSFSGINYPSDWVPAYDDGSSSDTIKCDDPNIVVDVPIITKSNCYVQTAAVTLSVYQDSGGVITTHTSALCTFQLYTACTYIVSLAAWIQVFARTGATDCYDGAVLTNSNATAYANHFRRCYGGTCTVTWITP